MNLRSCSKKQRLCRKLLGVLLIVSFVFPVFVSAQRPGEPDSVYMARTKWWQDARMGLAMHWGVGCKYKNDAGCQLSWGRPGGTNRHLEYLGRACDPNPKPCATYEPTYDGLAKDFNPVNFDPDSIVRLAKRAGMGYIILTAKHHEGFAMWHTKQIHSKNLPGSVYGTEPHSIAKSEWGKTHDPVKMLADACAKEKIAFGIYYSPRDWYNPDFGVGDNQIYKKYMYAQLTELLGGDYGRISLVWWDGFGYAPGPKSGSPYAGIDSLYWEYEEGLDSVYSMCPWIISNPRYCYSRGGRWGRGDFDAGEGSIVTNPKRLFECILGTLNGGWGWQRGGKPIYPLYREGRTGNELLPNLVYNATHGPYGGNFTPNVDPKPDGSLPPDQVKRLEELAAWMDVHGKAIKKTRKGPIQHVFDKGKTTEVTVESTCRDSLLYIFLMGKWASKMYKPWKGGTVTFPAKGLKMLNWQQVSPGTQKVELNNDKFTITVNTPELPAHMIEIKVDKRLWDSTQYYDPKWDPFADTTTGIRHAPLSQAAKIRAAAGAMRICGDNFLLPASWGKGPFHVGLFNINGRMVKEQTLTATRVNLEREFGVAPGAYILKMLK